MTNNVELCKIFIIEHCISNINIKYLNNLPLMRTGSASGSQGWTRPTGHQEIPREAAVKLWLVTPVILVIV